MKRILMVAVAVPISILICLPLCGLVMLECLMSVRRLISEHFVEPHV